MTTAVTGVPACGDTGPQGLNCRRDRGHVGTHTYALEGSGLGNAHWESPVVPVSAVMDGWREVTEKAFNRAMERDNLNWVIDDSIQKTLADDGKYDGVMNAWLEQARNEPRTNPSPFHTAVYAVYDEARELLLRKHADYGPKNISGSPGGPLNGLRVRAWDKMARINNLIDSGAEPEHESLRDSFLDLANYALIGLLVIDGSWPE